MTGGLIQLVAYGVQDVFLTGTPQITFFKKVYKRHTNFAQEEFEQAFSGPMDFATRNDVQIARRGDLMTNMTLEMDLTPNNLSMNCDYDTMATEMEDIVYLAQKHKREVASSSITTATITPAQTDFLLHTPVDSYVNPRFSHYASRTGHILINHVEIEIGGQQIDKQYGEWLELWSQLTDSAQKQQILSNMVSIDNSFDGRVYVPLRFWFCMNPGLALPLVALQYHDVFLYLTLNNKQSLESDYYNRIVQLEAISNITTGETGDTLGDSIVTALKAKFTGANLPTSTQLSGLMGIERVALFVNYIYLDTDERRRFAQQSHEYLITQLQQNTANTVPAGGSRINIDMNFNHPVKQLVWAVQNIGNRGDNAFNYWNGNLPGPTQSPYLSSTINSGLKLGDQVKDALITLNGSERFQSRRGAYFRLVQPYYYNTGGANYLPQNIFTGKPGMATYMAQAMTTTLSSINTDSKEQGTYSQNRLLSAGKNSYGGFYNYSFALNPQDDQPSGTCNFSRLDTATLILDLYPSNNGAGESISRSVNIYALNYNILRVTNGMGGLAYAN